MPLPALVSLRLADANLSNEGSLWISQGSWPLLEDLRLEGNPLGCGDLREVLRGKWPQLRSLSLSFDMLQMHASNVLLGLDVDEVHGLAGKLVQIEQPNAHKSAVFLRFPRVASQLGEPVWPKLREVLARSKLHNGVSQADLGVSFITFRP